MPGRGWVPESGEGARPAHLLHLMGAWSGAGLCRGVVTYLAALAPSIPPGLGPDRLGVTVTAISGVLAALTKSPRAFVRSGDRDNLKPKQS